MKRNARTAFNKLTKMGVRVTERKRGNCHFVISAKDNNDCAFADYYDAVHYGGLAAARDCGVTREITDVLIAHGLMAEWINDSLVGVYETI